MKFDGSRKDGVIGIAFTSMGGVLGFATILMQIIDPVTLALTSSIILIVSAVLFGIGAISLMLNSKEIGDKAVDEGSSFLIQAIFILSMFLVVLGGIFVTL